MPSSEVSIQDSVRVCEGVQAPGIPERFCTLCGEMLGANSIVFAGRHYCPACFERGTVMCENCGTRILRGEATRVESHWVCESCADNSTFVCDRCGERHWTSAATDVYDGESSQPVRNQTPVRRCEDCDGDTWVCEHCGFTFLGCAEHPFLDNEPWCRHCVQSTLWYCDDCDAYFSNGEACNCGDEEADDREDVPAPAYDPNHDHGNYCDPAASCPKGKPSARFTQRFVGLEMETGSGASGRDFTLEFRRKLKHWGIHSDGSLRDGGREFVSPPICGTTIEKDLAMFYGLTTKHHVHVKDIHAGAHVHVDASDIFNRVAAQYSNALTDRGVSNYGKGGAAQAYKTGRNREDFFKMKLLHRTELLEDSIQSWGIATTDLCRQFVDSARRSNQYCATDFAIRGSHHRCLCKAKGGGYPALAIRENTFEFRLFPSTDIVEEHLSMVELSQRTVDFLATVMEEPVSKKRNRMLAKYSKIVETLEPSKLEDMQELLSISSKSMETLRTIWRKNIEGYKRDAEALKERRIAEARDAEIRAERERQAAIRAEEERRAREALLARASEVWAEALRNREELLAQGVPAGTFCPVCQQYHS